MNTKQVKSASQSKTQAQNGNQSKNLYMSVNTFDHDGKTVGERIVDLYHFGTRNWLASHTWWAMHQGHTVEQNPATSEQIVAYIAEGATALFDKYNATTAAAQPELVTA